MRFFRHLALLFLVLYAAFAVGIYLHSHADGNDPFHHDCQICQASSVALIQTSEIHCSPQISELGMLVQFAEKQSREASAPASFGRAPPLA